MARTPDPLNAAVQISEALAKHRGDEKLDHAAKSVKTMHLDTLDGVDFVPYTDATRPAANSVPAGRTIYNSDDHGLNVSDGTNWRSPTWAVT
jgi:hypothetical protein